MHTSSARSSPSKNTWIRLAFTLVALTSLPACTLSLDTGPSIQATIGLPTAMPSPTASLIPATKTLAPAEVSLTPAPAAATVSSVPVVSGAYEERLRAAKPDIERASLLMSQDKYADAMDAWGRVIEQVPEYSDGYLQRAIARIRSPMPNILEIYLDRLRAALDDLDQSIVLAAKPPGDAFYYRHVAYEGIGREQLLRVDQDAYLKVALENLEAANAIGPKTVDRLQEEATLLFWLAECDEGLTRVRKFLPTLDMSDKPSFAFAHSALSSGFVCKGQLGTALQEIDAAIAAESTPVRQYRRAIILAGLGRLQEARKQLDALIEAEPSYGGYRYQLRAYVDYLQDRPDEARKDLAVGAANTWSQAGLPYYVSGHLAIDAGDVDAGIESLQLAEASLSREYGPLLGRIQNELRQLHVTPLSPTASVELTTTPIPTVMPTNTPRPFRGVPGPTPQGMISVDAATGTGELVLHPNDYPVYRFIPRPTGHAAVRRLIVVLLPSGEQPADKPSLVIMLWSQGNGWAQVDNPHWGVNEVANAGFYVFPGGDVVLGIRNFGPDDVSLQTIAVGFEAESTGGIISYYGWIP